MTLILFAAFLSIVLACPFVSLMNARGAKFSDESLKNFHAKQKVEKKRNVEQSTKAEQTFVLSSRIKTPSSLVFGQGFAVGFTVNGFETPEINLIAGKTYNFTVVSGCNHPFYLAFDVRGTGRSPVVDGWPNNKPPTPFIGGDNAICGGKSILWTPPGSLITTNANVKQIYYHCFVHDNMGWKVNIKEESFCDKYTDALSSVVSNNAGLISFVVNKLLAALTEPTNDLIDYFNGEVPTGSIDFTDAKNSVQAAKLANNLVTFFGAALGCSDGSIGPYTGGDMRTVHASMPIGPNEFDSFVNKLGKILTDIGVRTADLDSVVALLNSAGVRGRICNLQADCFESICNTYSKKNAVGVIDAGANKALMSAIVGASFAKVLADPVLITYFNGAKPAGSTDFTKDAAKTQALQDRFAAFIGSPPIFGCTDPKFPGTNYTVGDLKATHFFMGIGPADFFKFNNLVIAAVKDLGVNAADQVTIRKVLDSTEPLICTAPGCSTVPLATNSKIYDVTVAPKVAGHHYFGKGFSAAFKLDGQTAEGLNLEVGKEYGFRSNVSCFHPFYVSDGTGGGSNETQDGITQGFGDNTCAGKTLIFKPTAAQMGKKLFYACRNHDLMGGALCIVAAGVNTPCTVTGGAPPPPESLSPCDDLTQTVRQTIPTATSLSIITDVVVSTFTKGVGSPLKKFFDGTQPAGSTDFTVAGPNQSRFVSDLVKFFATNLGCTDNSVVRYAPGTVPDMKTIHQNMNIDKASFDLFNTVLIGELKNYKGMNFGMSATNVGKAYQFLNATSPDICAGCADYNGPSLCEKWATASTVFKGDQKKMITAVVTGVFTILVADPMTKPLFDGTVPCKSRDFIGDKINQGGLVTTLVAFFGQPGVLGCTQSDFPQFRGNSDMEAVHREMPINKAMFDLFINSLVSVVQGALSADVQSLATDLLPIATLLSSPAITVICNQPDCTGITKGTYVQRICPTAAIRTATTTASAKNLITTTTAANPGDTKLTTTASTSPRMQTATVLSSTTSKAVVDSLDTLIKNNMAAFISVCVGVVVFVVALIALIICLARRRGVRNDSFALKNMQSPHHDSGGSSEYASIANVSSSHYSNPLDAKQPSAHSHYDDPNQFVDLSALKPQNHYSNISDIKQQSPHAHYDDPTVFVNSQQQLAGPTN